MLVNATYHTDFDQLTQKADQFYNEKYYPYEGNIFQCGYLNNLLITGLVCLITGEADMALFRRLGAVLEQRIHYSNDDQDTCRAFIQQTTAWLDAGKQALSQSNDKTQLQAKWLEWLNARILCRFDYFKVSGTVWKQQYNEGAFSQSERVALAKMLMEFEVHTQEFRLYQALWHFPSISIRAFLSNIFHQTKTLSAFAKWLQFESTCEFTQAEREQIATIQCGIRVIGDTEFEKTHSLEAHAAIYQAVIKDNPKYNDLYQNPQYYPGFTRLIQFCEIAGFLNNFEDERWQALVSLDANYHRQPDLIFAEQHLKPLIRAKDSDGTLCQLYEAIYGHQNPVSAAPMPRYSKRNAYSSSGELKAESSTAEAARLLSSANGANPKRRRRKTKAAPEAASPASASAHAIHRETVPFSLYQQLNAKYASLQRRYRNLKQQNQDLERQLQRQPQTTNIPRHSETLEPAASATAIPTAVRRPIWEPIPPGLTVETSPAGNIQEVSLSGPDGRPRPITFQRFREQLFQAGLFNTHSQPEETLTGRNGQGFVRFAPITLPPPPPTTPPPGPRSGGN